MDAHGQRDFVACAVAAYYLQCHYPDLLEGNYDVRAGQPRLKDSGLQTYFVYDTWRAEMRGDEQTDPKTAETALRCCADWYDYPEERCAAAIEFEAWLREEPAPPFICLVAGYNEAAYADNGTYLSWMPYDIALYTRHRDYATEKRIRDALEAAECPFTLSITNIDSEELTEAAFTVNVAES